MASNNDIVCVHMSLLKIGVEWSDAQREQVCKFYRNWMSEHLDHEMQDHTLLGTELKQAKLRGSWREHLHSNATCGMLVFRCFDGVFFRLLASMTSQTSKLVQRELQAFQPDSIDDMYLYPHVDPYIMDIVIGFYWTQSLTLPTDTNLRYAMQMSQYRKSPQCPSKLQVLSDIIDAANWLEDECLSDVAHATMRHIVYVGHYTVPDLLQCVDRVFCGVQTDRSQLKARERILLWGLLKTIVHTSCDVVFEHLQLLLGKSSSLKEMYLRGVELVTTWPDILQS